MSIATAAPRFALIVTGILMVVLAAVASVMTAPTPADASASESVVSVVSVAVETGLTSGATATGSIGNLG